MRFLIDQQLPPVLAEHLRSGGHDAVHVRDLDLSTAPDGAIWQEAQRDDAVIVSRDADFVPRVQNPGGARLIWVRVGNCTNAELLAAFARSWSEVQSRLGNGERLVEIRL